MESWHRDGTAQKNLTKITLSFHSFPHIFTFPRFSTPETQNPFYFLSLPHKLNILLLKWYRSFRVWLPFWGFHLFLWCFHPICIWNKPFFLLIVLSFQFAEPQILNLRGWRTQLFFPLQQYNLPNLYFWLSSLLFCLLKHPMRYSSYTREGPGDRWESPLLVVTWL